MNLTTKGLVTALLLLPLAFSAGAFAGNDRDDDRNGGWNSRDNDRGNGWNNGRDSDRDDDDKWNRSDDRWDDDDWNKSWNGSWKKDYDDWSKKGWGHSDGKKIFICHRTSSRTNSYVLIEVSVSAKQTHYNHGDPTQFTATGNGGCRPGTTPPAPSKPNVSLSLAADWIYTGATTTATWTSTNATSCKLGSDTVATSGSAPVGPFSSTGSKTITVSCIGAGGSDSDSETLVVKSAPAAAPVVTLTIEPGTIKTGEKAKLSWDSTGAKSCKLQGSGSLYSNSFSISVDDDGFYMKGPFSKPGQATYTVTCTGPGGTDSESVTLTVVSPVLAPTVTLNLAADSVVQNTGTTTATWTSANANTCSLTSNGVTTGVALNGTATVGTFATTGPQTVSITCTGASGTTPATASRSLTVTAPPPPTTQKLCMSSDFIGTGNLVWVVDYNLQTGEFSGSSATVGAPLLSGGADPANGVSVANALFSDGTKIDVGGGGMLGLANGATVNGGEFGANGYAVYEIELFTAAAPAISIGFTSLVVHGANFCTELGGNTPPPI